MRRRLPLVLLVCLMVPLAAPARAAYRSGCTWVNQKFTVCFSDPTDDTAAQRQVIPRKIKQAIDTTGPGDVIDVAMYTWTYQRMADRLLAAAKRNAKVRIVLHTDGDHPSTPATELAGKDPDLRLFPCPVDDNCLPESGGRGINHNKFVRIQYGSTNTRYRNQTYLAQTSMNFTRAQFNLYNDLLVVRNNAGLNAAYREYHRRLRTQTWTAGSDWWSDDEKRRPGDGLTRAWFFPRNTGDPYVTMLNNIKGCSGTSNKVWAAMAHYNDRGAVISRLNQLEEMGCDVRVIVQDAHDEQQIQRLGIKKVSVKHTRTGDELHSKFLVVDAYYVTGSSSAWRSFVVTGSHNWTRGANYDNDEAMIRVDDNGVVARYQAVHRALFDGRTCQYSDTACG